MNPNKLSAIALVVVASAIVLNIATTGFSSISNSAKIDAIGATAQRLTTENLVLKGELAHSRAMLKELDTGLTALASVLKVDPKQLSAAILAVQEVNAHAASVTPALTQSPGTGDAVLLEATEGSTNGKVNLFSVADDEDKARELAKVLAGDDAPALSVILGNTAPAPAPRATIDEVDAILGARITEKWFKPADAKDNLTAVLQLKMTRDGKVISATIIKPSGHSKFDESVVNAIGSIEQIEQVAHLSDDDYAVAYKVRHIQFTPQMGR